MVNRNRIFTFFIPIVSFLAFRNTEWLHTQWNRSIELTDRKFNIKGHLPSKGWSKASHQNLHLIYTSRSTLKQGKAPYQLGLHITNSNLMCIINNSLLRWHILKYCTIYTMIACSEMHQCLTPVQLFLEIALRVILNSACPVKLLPKELQDHLGKFCMNPGRDECKAF